MGTGAQPQLPPLPVLQHALNRARWERFWAILAVPAIVAVYLFYLLMLPRLQILWTILVCLFMLPVGWWVGRRVPQKTHEISVLKWQIAWAKGTTSQPPEEPTDWSRGKLGLVVALLGIFVPTTIALTQLLLTR